MNSIPNDPTPSQSPLEQQGRKRSHIRIIAFIVGVHVVFLGGILIQGCKPGETTKTANSSTPAATNDSGLPQENPKYYKSLDPASNVVSSPTQFPAPEVGAGTNAVAQGFPPATEPPNAPSTQATSEYEIKAGDSFAKVAKSHGVGLKAILAANPGVDAARLKVGQRIQVPPPQASPTEQTVGKGSSTNGADKSAAGGDYAVKSGDSLIKIAKSHGVSVKALKSANGLKTDRIHAGQKLKIPAMAASAPKETASAPVTPSTN